MKVFVFPGQGSQAVGMGRELADAFPEARAVFEEVDEALQQNLTRLMFDGPAEELTLTQNAQPALMAVSMAVVQILDKTGYLMENADYMAGHSLGEYSALCAAGALSLTDTARLLQRRGKAMQRAVPVGEGAMAALLGLSFEDAKAAADAASQEGGICTPANDNAPGQVVISGHKATVEKAIELAKAAGAKKAMMLPVSAPFHCPLMQPAADEMAEALADAQIKKPVRPIITNVTAQPCDDPDELRALLVAQVTGLVRWRESMLWFGAQGGEQLFEMGSGKVLTGLIKRINRDIPGSALNAPADIESFLAQNG